MYLKFSSLICDFLGTDQNHYVEQQPDGVYYKKAGYVSPELISNELRHGGSIAIYQKNTDLTIKWICFDFDVLKACLSGDLREEADKELEQTVTAFCLELRDLDIPYLLEFSGNRGFHVWVTFSESINYHTGYDIQQAILKNADLVFNENLIGIDLFPHSATPTGGVGLGVKIPLSKHKKSGNYSYLLSDVKSIKSVKYIENLTEEFIAENNSILEKHKSISRSELECHLGEFFESYRTDLIQCNRIKSIKIQRVGFELDELLEHWKLSPPLAKLAKDVEEGSNLSHSQRKLVVGLLCNIVCRDSPTFSDDILHKIFGSLDNYNKKITTRAISSLRSFNFPTKEQIENTLNCKFEGSLDVEGLIKACIPKFHSYSDANFEFSNKDIEISRAAELNYLFMNDEVQAKVVIEELSSKDNSEFLQYLEDFINGDKNWGLYKHTRNEKNKTRELITLNSNSRVATSCILKQISYYLDLKIDENSHGYQINKGFSNGYIFQPWLYLWLKFISNITDAIENKSYKNFYIVKTDIKSFYENIPHDNLKRLLLGDGNSLIKNKVMSMKEETNTRYQRCLSALFKLTVDIVGSNKGLPQGPAYARYFAELYLSDLDTSFQNKINSNEVLLYQRYVDDIFFVTRTKTEAENLLSELKTRLDLLNLEINPEKTVISNIASFHEDFNRYRSQSKYTVDQVSRTFVTSSEKQKNVAIDEFVALIQSDSCQDDLSFIFSHLHGVDELNFLKNEQILPALKNGIGRGSLYKNLFNYVLELNDGWEVIYEIPKYDGLQSEVITSCLINSLEVNKGNREKLILIVEKISSALTKTELVSEHLAYLVTAYDCQVDVETIDPKFFMAAIASVSNCKNIKVSSKLLSHLNIAINELKSMTDFVKVIYAFCYNENINEDDLNDLSALFYSKMGVEEKEKRLIFVSEDNELIDPITVNKFYYLLCVFSVSNKNKSTELITSMWKYCATVFNKSDFENLKFSPPNWLEKLKLIEIDHTIANWIISSIVDGNLFRGESDEKKIFEQYHNALMVFLTLNEHSWVNNSISVQLEKLKQKSTFYKWLIDNDGVSIFPHNKKWFERNIIENSITTLKKDNQILLRKPTPDFSCDTEGLEVHNGYSELLITHENKCLDNFRTNIDSLSLNEKFNLLLRLLDRLDENTFIPSYFCPDRAFNSEEEIVFSAEFIYQSKILFDDEEGNIFSFDKSKDNFIKCFLNYIAYEDETARKLQEQYFNNLEANIDKHVFINKFSSQLRDCKAQDVEFYHDIAISSALYLYYSDYDPFKRLDLFVQQHSSFYEVDNEAKKHIFAVKKGMLLNDSSPAQLFKTIRKSVELITDYAVKQVPFFLKNDINSYEECLSDLIFNSALGESKIQLTDFILSDVRTSFTSRIVNVDAEKYEFSNVKIINPILREFSNFEIRHLNLISRSDHIYSYTLNDVVYLFAANTFVSKIYSIIKKRYELIIEEQKREHSYVISDFNRGEIQGLNGFDDAQTVVKHHRGISNEDAKELLINWLTHLPIKFHQTLITCIQGHEYMRESELSKFVDKVKNLDSSDANLFLIKRVEDYNGTHRVLYRDQEIGRDVSTFTPISIPSDCKEATLIADLILTGAQIKKAFEYYFKGKGNSSTNNYFECSETEQEKILNTFKNMDTLKICTILYTKEAVKKIQSKLQELLENNIKVEVINGRDISGNAFFGKTEKISEKDKISIKSTLCDSNNLSTLYDYLSFTGKVDDYGASKSIESMNLVARFQSLPKKSFDFLRFGLKADKDCKPFNRILELSDKK